jgi:RNA polymerase sigma factor (sigma-70 family)
MSRVNGNGDNQSPSPLTSASESLLVTTAKNGEHSAYAELCRRHRDRVFRTILGITRNMDDAEDILQDSWMRAFIHIGTFDGKSAFSTWMTRIAINSALSMLRKRRGKRELSLDDSVTPDGPRLSEMMEQSHNPEERCIEAEAQRLLREAIQCLPSNLREAIEIRQSRDGSVNEIAMMAGISGPAMKSRLFAARRKLRKLLRQVLKARASAKVADHGKGQRQPKECHQRIARRSSVIDGSNQADSSVIGQQIAIESSESIKGFPGHWDRDRETLAGLTAAVAYRKTRIDETTQDPVPEPALF